MIDIAIITCPPLSKYPEKPADISKAEIVDCPKCNEKMWYSEKKKAIKLLCETFNKEIIYCCHDCMKKIAEKDPELFSDSVRVDI